MYCKSGIFEARQLTCIKYSTVKNFGYATTRPCIVITFCCFNFRTHSEYSKIESMRNIPDFCMSVCMQCSIILVTGGSAIRSHTWTVGGTNYWLVVQIRQHAQVNAHSLTTLRPSFNESTRPHLMRVQSVHVLIPGIHIRVYCRPFSE